MNPFATRLLCVLSMGCALLAQTPQAAPAPEGEKAGAYYNFAMGRLYAVMAENEGNKNDYVSKAIQYYQEALKVDPSATMIFEELTDLYIATNRLADAVSQAEGLLKK